MSRYAAFLRGMNVGGHRLTNKELCAHFEAMGFAQVATFRASGNVVFAITERDADRGSEERLQARIEQALEQELGYAVPTFLRSHAEVRAIAAAQPFTAERVQSSAGKLQVLLLAGEPSKRARSEVLAMASEEDALALAGRELYWLPSGGLLESALDLKAIDRLLGAGTMRTKGTLEQIAAKHCAE
jgi:uncharacterized protein (DUF1697 family)